MAWWWTKQQVTPPAVEVSIAETAGVPVALDRTSMHMLKEYVRSIYLWRSVDMIAQMSSAVALEVDDAGKQLTPADKAVQQLLQHPNPQWTSAALQYFLAASLAVANRSYLKRVRGVGGVTLELWPINADEVTIKYLNGSKVLAGFTQTTSAGPVEYPIDETGDCDLIYIHRPALNSQSDRSPAAVAAPPAEVFTRILQRCADIVSNSSNITGLLSTEQEMAQKAVEEVKNALNNFKLRGAESGGTLVTANAKWQLTRMSEDPSSALSVEIKDSLARDVVMTFGVPTQLVGIPGQDTYNNITNARVGFLTDTVLPGYVNPYVAALNAALLPKGPARIRPDVARLPAMVAARLQLVETAARATMLSVNEQRRLIGYPPYDDDLADVPVLVDQMQRQRLQIEVLAGQVGVELEGEKT